MRAHIFKLKDSIPENQLSLISYKLNFLSDEIERFYINPFNRRTIKIWSEKKIQKEEINQLVNSVRKESH